MTEKYGNCIFAGLHNQMDTVGLTKNSKSACVPPVNWGVSSLILLLKGLFSLTPKFLSPLNVSSMNTPTWSMPTMSNGRGQLFMDVVNHHLLGLLRISSSSLSKGTSKSNNELPLSKWAWNFYKNQLTDTLNSAVHVNNVCNRLQCNSTHVHVHTVHVALWSTCTCTWLCVMAFHRIMYTTSLKYILLMDEGK